MVRSGLIVIRGAERAGTSSGSTLAYRRRRTGFLFGQERTERRNVKENATGRVPVCGRGKERIEEERVRGGRDRESRSDRGKKEASERKKGNKREERKRGKKLACTCTLLALSKEYLLQNLQRSRLKKCPSWRQKGMGTRALTYRNLQRAVFALINRNRPRLSHLCYMSGSLETKLYIVSGRVD